MRFAKGMRMPEDGGDANDLSVFFGFESCYRGPEFLIYGVDKPWLKAHPQLKDASMAEQYRLVHEAGGMVIQAHPFREEDYMEVIGQYPDLVDGLEGVNATHCSPLSLHHKNPQWDRQARELARRKGLPITAGSDVHSTVLFGGGVAFKRKLASIEDYCAAILGGEDYILTDGNDIPTFVPGGTGTGISAYCQDYTLNKRICPPGIFHDILSWLCCWYC